MKLKVCGLREDENVKAIAALQPQWLGFIFHSASPRYFMSAKNPVDLLSIPLSFKKVGVFVNSTIDEVVRLHKLYSLDYTQLHGDENADFCKQLQMNGIKIIKAFRINESFDFASVDSYLPFVELFLFDASGKEYGGNGITFNWELLKNKRFSKPFLLSGGIGLEQVEALKSFDHPDLAGVDVNSRFESSPGLKDVLAVQLFQQQIT